MSKRDFKSTSDTTEGDNIEPSSDTQTEVGSPSKSMAAKPMDESRALTKDVIFDILKNQRRRRSINYLRTHGSSTLSDLAENVAAMEHDKNVQSLTSDERKRVYVGLYQCHLPRMDDVGVIKFNRARGTVELLESASQMFPYLDLDASSSTAGTGASREWLSDRLVSLSTLLNR